MYVLQSSWLVPLHDKSRFPSGISQPLYDSVTLLESTSPVKLPVRQCFAAGFLCGSAIRVSIFKERCSIVVRLAADSLLPSTVKNAFPVSNCSKAPRGLFVHVCVGRIFTAISISPGNGSRQLLSRSTFRAGRNFTNINDYSLRRLYLYQRSDRR